MSCCPAAGGWALCAPLGGPQTDKEGAVDWICNWQRHPIGAVAPPRLLYVAACRRLVPAALLAPTWASLVGAYKTAWSGSCSSIICNVGSQLSPSAANCLRNSDHRTTAGHGDRAHREYTKMTYKMHCKKTLGDSKHAIQKCYGSFMQRRAGRLLQQLSAVDYKM